MNRRFNTHFFWGQHSPLSSLSKAGLIIMASSRFSFALICSLALVWVYGLTTLVFLCARPIMPSAGKKVILLFLSAFLCAIFMLLLGFLNPLLILGTTFFILLIPVCCLGSTSFEAAGSTVLLESVSRAVIEALTLGGVIVALALIREPLGMGILSFPGGVQGIIELFVNQDADSIIPVRIFSISAGGLLLLGYSVALYRYFREQNGSAPHDEDMQEGN